MGFYILPDNKGFYDPDGYFFNEKGFDEFGGYYDNEGLYHPGPGNMHEFPDYKKSANHQNDYDHRRGGGKDTKKGKRRVDYEEDDDLIKAFERGDDEDFQDDHDDPTIKKYLNEYKKVEEIIGGPDILEEE